MNEERRKILQLVEAGKISAEEAADLLQVLHEPDGDSEEVQEEPTSPWTGAERSRGLTHRAPYWLYAMAAGTIVILLGGTVISSSSQQGRAGVGTLLCGWIPLVLGMSLAVIGVWLRTARWVHLRVKERDHALHFSVPVPLGLGAAVLGFARGFVPRLRDTAIDEALLALRDGLTDEEPITIEVDDHDEGEHVEITFG